MVFAFFYLSKTKRRRKPDRQMKRKETPPQEQALSARRRCQGVCRQVVEVAVAAEAGQQ
jgi:hypothetical protein